MRLELKTKNKKNFIILIILLVLFINLNLINIVAPKKDLETNFEDNSPENLKPSAPKNTSILITNYTQEVNNYQKRNITIDFFFNDTTSNIPITGLNNSNVIVSDNNGNDWGNVKGDHNYTLHPGKTWNYILNVSTKGYDPGEYTLILNISKLPEYNWSIESLRFEILANYSRIILDSISYPGIEFSPERVNNSYYAFKGENLSLSFKMIDYEKSKKNLFQEDYLTLFNVYYKNFNNQSDNGNIQYDFNYDEENMVYEGNLDLDYLNYGNYSIKVGISLAKYDIVPLEFKIKIIEKYESKVSIGYPSKITSGEETSISVRSYYLDKDNQLIIKNPEITIEIFINNMTYKTIKNLRFDENGLATFYLKLPLSAKSLVILGELSEGYYYQKTYSEEITLKVNHYLDFLLPFIIQLLFIIMIIISLGLYISKKVSVKKRNNKKKLVGYERKLKSILKLHAILILDKIEENKILFYKIYPFNRFHSKYQDKSNILDFIKDLEFQNSKTYNFPNFRVIGSQVKYTKIFIFFQRIKGFTIEEKTIRELQNLIENYYKKYFLNTQEESKFSELVEIEINNLFYLYYLKPHKISKKNVRIESNPYILLFPEIVVNHLKRVIFNIIYDKNKEEGVIRKNIRLIIKKTINRFQTYFPVKKTFYFRHTKLKNNEDIKLLRNADNIMRNSPRSFFYLSDIITPRFNNTTKDLLYFLERFNFLRNQGIFTEVKSPLKILIKKLDLTYKKILNIDGMSIAFRNYIKDLIKQIESLQDMPNVDLKSSLERKFKKIMKNILYLESSYSNLKLDFLKGYET